MVRFPDTEKKLRSTISRYKSAFKKEKKEHGMIRDGSGKRYLLFCFYQVLGDMVKACDYIAWYETEFPDDVGEPIQKLSWALMLYRMEEIHKAQYKLADLMLSNLYLIPCLIGRPIEKLGIWHSSNYEWINYIECMPEAVKGNITEAELQWMAERYDSFEFRRIRKRYIEIYQQLQYTKELEERITLLDEAESLLGMLR